MWQLFCYTGMPSAVLIHYISNRRDPLGQLCIGIVSTPDNKELESPWGWDGAVRKAHMLMYASGWYSVT